MPLTRPHSFRFLGETNVARTKNRSSITVSKRRQLLDLFDGAQRKLAKGRFGVDLDLGHAIFFAYFTRNVLAKLATERVDLRFVDLKTGGRGMASMRNQMVTALRESPMKVETRRRASGTLSRLYT